MKFFEVVKEFSVDFQIMTGLKTIKERDAEFIELRSKAIDSLKKMGCTQFREMQQYFNINNDIVVYRLSGLVVVESNKDET